MTAKRAAIYARVSTAEQVEGTSLATQVSQCERYLAAQDWQLQGTFIDEGISGAKARRPALDKLLAEVTNDRVDVVVVAKLDRIGRSMRHLAALLGELDDRHVGLVSVSESFDSSTPAGRLQRNMLGSFAEFERELIRDRMISGRDATVRAGKWASIHAPYGYRADPPAYLLQIDPHEADVIRLIVDLFVNQRTSTPQIAAKLNGLGLQPRRSDTWSAASVRWVLRESDHLSGTFTWRRASRGYQGPPITVQGPALIDPVTHDRLRARLTETATKHTAHPERYLLAGRITSPHGTLMYGYCTNTPLYRCSDFFTKTAPPEGRTCDCKTVRGELVEKIVWEEDCALLSNPDRLMAMAGLHLAKGAATINSGAADIAAIDRRINRLEKAAGAKLSKLLADGLDPAIAAHAAQSLTDQLAAAKAHRAQVITWQGANLEARDRSRHLLDLAEQAERILPAADTATKRQVLALLDVQVQVSGWEPCETCTGTGWISKYQPGQAPRAESGLPRVFCGIVCPTCHRHRWMPRFTIEGTIPEIGLHTAPETQDSARLPFKVVGCNA